MGTDLIQIGDHKIKFKQRNFKDIATEILDRLNKITFVNAEYLRLFALRWENSAPRNVRSIREIKSTKEWSYREEDEYFQYEKFETVDFKGPFNLSLYFNKDYIYFFNPPVRYSQWIEGDDFEDFEFRNEWRKYMYQIVHAFGGDRVIYLADNAHPLDGFAYMEVPFDEIETALKKKFGKPKTTFKEFLSLCRSSRKIKEPVVGVERR